MTEEKEYRYAGKSSGCPSTDTYIMNGGYVACRNPHKKTTICEMAEVYDHIGRHVMNACCFIDLANLRNTSVDTAMQRVTLTDAQKRGYNSDQAALVTAGYYDATMNLVSERHFINFLVAKFEAEYAADAQAKLAADDAEKAGIKAAQEAVNKVKSK